MGGSSSKLDKQIRNLGVDRELMERACKLGLYKNVGEVVSHIKKSFPSKSDKPASFLGQLRHRLDLQREIDDKLYENLVNMSGYTYVDELRVVMVVDGEGGMLIAPRGIPVDFAIQRRKFFLRFKGDDPNERSGGKTPLIQMCHVCGKTASDIKKAAEKAARSCHEDTWTRAEFPIILTQPTIEADVVLNILLKHDLAKLDLNAGDECTDS